MTIEPQRSQGQQVADLLRAELTAGTYPWGSDFPSERDLEERFGVSRNTIHEAVLALRGEGWLRVRRGQDTIVRLFNPAHRIPRNALARYDAAARERNQGRGAFDAEIKALGYVPRVESWRGEVQAPARVAEILGESRVFIRGRKMFASDEPVQLAPSYIPLDVAVLSLSTGPNQGQPLMAEDSGIGGIVSRYTDLGIPQVRITEQITTRRGTPEELAFLELEERQPVLEIIHTGWTKDGRPVEVAVHSVSASAWEFDYEFTIA
jgi:GntR family transcriptional regulator